MNSMKIPYSLWVSWLQDTLFFLIIPYHIPQHCLIRRFFLSLCSLLIFTVIIFTYFHSLIKSIPWLSFRSLITGVFWQRWSGLPTIPLHKNNECTNQFYISHSLTQTIGRKFLYFLGSILTKEDDTQLKKVKVVTKNTTLDILRKQSPTIS